MIHQTWIGPLVTWDDTTLSEVAYRANPGSLRSARNHDDKHWLYYLPVIDRLGGDSRAYNSVSWIVRDRKWNVRTPRRTEQDFLCHQARLEYDFLPPKKMREHHFSVPPVALSQLPVACRDSRRIPLCDLKNLNSWVAFTLYHHLIDSEKEWELLSVQQWCSLAK